MMAPKLRFSRGLKAKAPGAVTACVPAATPLVETFTGHRYPPNTKSNDGEGEDFFFLLSRVFQVFQTLETPSKVKKILTFTFTSVSKVWLLF